MAAGSSASPKAHSGGKLLESANSQYLDNMCQIIVNVCVCDINIDVYFLCDLNIDWCPLKKKLQTVTSACKLVQLISQPTVPG